MGHSTPFFGNGTHCRSHRIKRACVKPYIRLLYAKSYNPKTKGKQKRYNRTADSLLWEAHLAKSKSLNELNYLYRVWVEECYLYIPHGALDGKSPLRHIKQTRTISACCLLKQAYAFFSCEKRKVDTEDCISFRGQKYEVGLGISLIHRDVDVVYAPGNITAVTIECGGFQSCHAKPLVITKYAAPKSELPEHHEKSEPQTSRL